MEIKRAAQCYCNDCVTLTPYEKQTIKKQYKRLRQDIETYIAPFPGLIYEEFGPILEEFRNDVLRRADDGGPWSITAACRIVYNGWRDRLRNMIGMIGPTIPEGVFMAVTFRDDGIIEKGWTRLQRTDIAA